MKQLQRLCQCLLGCRENHVAYNSNKIIIKFKTNGFMQPDGSMNVYSVTHKALSDMKSDISEYCYNVVFV